MLSSTISKRLLIGISVGVISACASAPAIPPEKLKDYSLLVPAELTGGITGSSSAITSLDGNMVLSFSGGTKDVPPGVHEIEITSCFNRGQNCQPRHYKFETKAGNAYIFRSPTKVDVYDRFDKSKPIDSLVLYKGSFVSESVASADAQANSAKQQAAIAAEKAAIIERRKLDLPRIRKVGTKVCKDSGNGYEATGFVEGVAEEKIQIRITDQYLKRARNVRPGGFTPSIIWDWPLNWDVCEG